MSLWDARAPELWFLILGLLGNVESRTRAAVLGWSGPTTRTDMVLMDIYDIYLRAHFTPPTPYPRPWDQKKTRNTKLRTAKEAMAILRPQKETDG